MVTSTTTSGCVRRDRSHLPLLSLDPIRSSSLLLRLCFFGDRNGDLAAVALLDELAGDGDLFVGCEFEPLRFPFTFVHGEMHRADRDRESRGLTSWCSEDSGDGHAVDEEAEVKHVPVLCRIGGNDDARLAFAGARVRTRGLGGLYLVPTARFTARLLRWRFRLGRLQGRRIVCGCLWRNSRGWATVGQEGEADDSEETTAHGGSCGSGRIILSIECCSPIVLLDY